MLNSSSKAELRLTLLNVAVFSAVLLTFTMAVFLVVSDSMRREMRSELERLADGVIASIDYFDEEDKRLAHPEPDMIASAMPESASALLNNLRLQWFGEDGKLIVEKGTLVVSLPLLKDKGFQEQKDPHAEVFTKPVYLNKAILGYVRVAQPLERLDRNIANLASGLILGLVAAILVTSGGIFILVRQSLLPVRQSMQRLRQFVGDASHEFRSPIMAILTNSSVALKYPDDMRERDKEKFELIETVAIQMRKLLEDLLLLAKAESIPETFEPVSLRATVNDALGNIGWLIEKNKAKLS
jgi:Signal transduction histidine kinase